MDEEKQTAEPEWKYSTALPHFPDNEANEADGYTIWVHATSPKFATAEEAYAWASTVIFARHRTRAEPDLVEECARIAERHAAPEGVPQLDYDRACRDIAASIRATLTRADV